MLIEILLSVILLRGIARSDKPNFVIILTDDQDVTLGGSLPINKTRRYVGEEGVTFENAYVTTPLCCPSRSSILTGLYTHSHGTVNNSLNGGCNGDVWRMKFEKRTFGAILHDHGYRTFYAGKYLNQYGHEKSGGAAHVPEGWDWWQGLIGNSVYYNYTLSINGSKYFRGDTEKDYLTDVLKEYSLEFLKNPAHPFLMVISTPSPHDPFTPAPRHKGKFSGFKAPRTSNFNKVQKETKHWLLRLPPAVLPRGVISEIDKIFRDRWETLLAVDDMVESIVLTLKASHVLNNTYVIYTSDNGFHLGQFGLPWDKRQPYETDIKIPLIIAGPQIPKKKIISHPVLNIDLAPTILELADIESPNPTDGKSFIPLVNEVPMTAPRRTFFVEYFGEGSGDRAKNCYSDPDVKSCSNESACKCLDSRNNTYNCLRIFDDGSNEIYCQFQDNENFRELYDLAKDPYQMHNLVYDAGEEGLSKYRDMLMYFKRRFSLWYHSPNVPKFNTRNRGKRSYTTQRKTQNGRRDLPDTVRVHVLRSDAEQTPPNPPFMNGLNWLDRIWTKEKCDESYGPDMEVIFPRNAHLKVIIRTPSIRTICRVTLIDKNENQLEYAKSGYSSTIISNGHGTFRVISAEAKYLCAQDINLVLLILLVKFFVIFRFFANHISMLKRSLSMEFDSNQFKSSASHQEPVNPGELVKAEKEDNNHSNKKMCHSPERTGIYEETDSNSRWSKHRKHDSYRFQQSTENSHVTQSKSIFSHENSCIYGNPKEDIKNIDIPELTKEIPLFDTCSVNALDLSCKSGKQEEEKSTEGSTYQNYPKNNACNENPVPRSNFQFKMVSPTMKKPSIPEQLQIAKIQQQQRRSIQQQQKLIQQMRRSLDPTGKNRSHHSNNTELSQSSQKNFKYFGSSTTNQEQTDLDYQGRMKEEYPQLPTSHFQQYPYFEPGQHKELPDGHPILPLLDPVYFSALYNAHGFLPPSSPSIAAAFIGTLQDALPKLPLMFPSTSSSNSPILPQKNNDNHN